MSLLYNIFRLLLLVLLAFLSFILPIGIMYYAHCNIVNLYSANDFCKENKRQTIYASDILDALKYTLQWLHKDVTYDRELDFEEFVGPLEEFLEGIYQKYNVANSHAEHRHENESKKANKSSKEHDHEVSLCLTLSYYFYCFNRKTMTQQVPQQKKRRMMRKIAFEVLVTCVIIVWAVN